MRFKEDLQEKGEKRRYFSRSFLKPPRISIKPLKCLEIALILSWEPPDTHWNALKPTWASQKLLVHSREPLETLGSRLKSTKAFRFNTSFNSRVAVSVLYTAHFVCVCRLQNLRWPYWFRRKPIFDIISFLSTESDGVYTLPACYTYSWNLSI